MAAELRTGSANLLLVSLYLQSATPASHYPNANILAELFSLVKNWQGPWLIMGDYTTFRHLRSQKQAFLPRPEAW